MFLMMKMQVIKEAEEVKQLLSKLSQLIPVSALVLLLGRSSLASAAEPGHCPSLLCLPLESRAALLLPGVLWLQEKFPWSDCHLLYQWGGLVLVSNWLTSALLHTVCEGTSTEKPIPILPIKLCSSRKDSSCTLYNA